MLKQCLYSMLTREAILKMEWIHKINELADVNDIIITKVKTDDEVIDIGVKCLNEDFG